MTEDTIWVNFLYETPESVRELDHRVSSGNGKTVVAFKIELKRDWYKVFKQFLTSLLVWASVPSHWNYTWRRIKSTFSRRFGSLFSRNRT